MAAHPAPPPTSPTPPQQQQIPPQLSAAAMIGTRPPLQVQPGRPPLPVPSAQQQVQPRARTRSPATATPAYGTTTNLSSITRSIAVPGPGAPVPNSSRAPQQHQAQQSTSPASSSSSSGSSVPAAPSAVGSRLHPAQRSTAVTPATTVSGASSPAARPQGVDTKPRIPAQLQVQPQLQPQVQGQGQGRKVPTSTGGDDFMMDGAASPPLAAISAGTDAVPAITPCAGVGGAVGGQAKVPAFLNKLFSMINDVATDPLIYWSEDGKSFFIPNAQQFGAILLPQFFKHRNFTSFVRQLNMYGFKKVPHLQSGVLSSFPQPTNELWEFSNPKFMRGHPELLGSITRKKSAKEMAASQAAAANQNHSQRGIAKGEGEEEHDDEDVNMDGHDPGFSGPSHVNGGTGAAQKPSTTAGDTSIVDPSAVNKALTVMHAHTSHLEKELAELKASNELLWRQAMVSREEQIKSQKKLDGVMRFLANQFGGMAVSLAVEEEVDPGARDTALHKPTQPHVRRLGKNRMIGDGSRRISGNASHGDDDGMLGNGLEDGHLWEDVEGNDKRDLWELGDDGEMVKVKNVLKRPTSRPGQSRSISTPNRHSFDRLPGSQRGSQDFSPSKRFVSLEASPEEMSNQSFDGTPTMNEPLAETPGTQLADLATVTANNQSLQPHASNALTTYQHPVHHSVNVQSFSLDPALLQLPLGTLLQTPAGAQLLANLSQAAADWVNQNAVAGKSTADAFATAAAASARPLSPRLTSAIASVATPVGIDRFQPVPSPSEQSAKTGDPLDPTPAGDMLWINDINELFTNASAVDPAAQMQPVPDPSYMPMPVAPEPIAPAQVENTPTVPVPPINWADPQVEALLNDLVADQSATAGGHVDIMQPFIDTNFAETNSGAPYDTSILSASGIDFEDPVFEFDFDNTFGNPMQASAISGPNSSTEDSTNTTPRLDQDAANAIDIMEFGNDHPLNNLSDMFGGPTRKKRKTDQREP